MKLYSKENIILELLAQEDRYTFTYGLDLQKRDKRIRGPSFYFLISSLEDKKLVRGVKDFSKRLPYGLCRRTYQITDAGRKTLDEIKKTNAQ